MNIEKQRAREFIKMYGGTVKVAKFCGVSKQAVSSWKDRGVPEGSAYKITILTRGQITVDWLRPDLFSGE